MKKYITDEKNGLDYSLVNGVYLPNVMFFSLHPLYEKVTFLISHIFAK